MVALMAVLLLALAPADVDLCPDTLEVGQVGKWIKDKKPIKFRVREIFDDALMVVGWADEPDILVSGMDTRGLADGKKIDLKGRWKVVKTQKWKGRTLYLVEEVK